MNAPETTPILEARGLTRRFGGLVACDNISFSIQSGEIFGLIGPNGAGKTTLFNLMTGMTRPDSGTLLWRGQAITGKRPAKIAALGIARTFQNIRLFGNLSALENVMIGAHLHTHSGVISGVLNLPRAKHEERLARERAHELLGLLDLDDKADALAHNLPYGDQRRLEIARALALRPSLLLLDEPGAGMNGGEKNRLSSLIRDLRMRFDLTILLIEHNVPLVMGICDRIAVLEFGHLIALGDPSVVRHDPAVIRAYLGDEDEDR
jgi:branched-chain amino acid transport system ATP-binding protein